MLCGGFFKTWAKANDQCVSYNFANRTWQLAGNMTERRRQPAYSVHPELGLIISGGYDGKKYLASTEATDNGRDFDADFAPMPLANHVHCQVTVNSSTVMAFGGCNSVSCFSKVAFKLDLGSRKWSRLPDMPTGRHGSGCGVVTSEGAGGAVVAKEVVVAAGNGGSGWTNVVEILTWPS